jgi:hypothetical protein
MIVVFGGDTAWNNEAGAFLGGKAVSSNLSLFDPLLFSGAHLDAPLAAGKRRRL